MIKSLLHFNNPDDLTKDEVEGVPWTVNGTVASSQDGRYGSIESRSSKYIFIDKNNTVMGMRE